MGNYFLYHLHSDLSNGVTNIDSVTKFDQYIEKARDCGMNALAFSEHGSVFSWVKKKEHIEKAGMKYVHAEEFYLTRTLYGKCKDNYHCILIAKNLEGVLELNKLSSIAFNRSDNHYYYVPRISFNELNKTSDNIIVTSACLASALAKSENSEAQHWFLNFLINNRHRCFLEIQHHCVNRQIAYNRYLYDISKKYGIPLVTGTDTHSLNKEHAEARLVLQKSKNIHFADEDAWDLIFKTYDELIEAYKKQCSLPIDIIREAIENTNVIADQVEEFELDRSYKYPHLWKNSEELFIQKIKEGIKKRNVDEYSNKQDYIDRIKYELKAYKHNEAIDFMLLMEDIVSWCRTQDIQIGYGRGSVNGSIIAWLLGITEMDSIKHKLNFDRFMNVERVSLSDIDTDFPPNKIEDVKNYIFNRAGLYCCDIITFNTIADKGAITDIGRALNIPLSEVRTISNSVDYENEYAQMREKYPELFKYVDIVKGVVVSIGSHPCGVVTSPFPVDTEFGLCSTSTDSHPISQIYMKEIDGLNYVKLDLLKLDTIRLISDTCKSVGIPMLTPDNVDVNDDAVWEDMKNDTTCIFQWESNTAAHYLKQLMSDDNMKKFKEIQPNIDRMTLLSIGNSAIRPAGASYRDDLANGVIRTTGSKPLDDFLKPTFGYLVFQCQIIDFLHQYCNFTMGEADVVRRCVEEHTWLYKPDGTYMYIMDAKKGDEILSYNLESRRLVYRKIEAVYKNGINYNMYEIVTDAGHGIRASGDHMILAPCGWLAVQELRIGDRIIGVKGFEIITNIVDIGFRRVYDLEVQGTHTYVAGGIVVHNCFAKKTGTEQAIPVIKNGGYLMDKDGNLKKNHYIDGFVKTMADKYNMPEEEANKTIVAFLKVIEDASNYLFSLNHSQPYSYEGYVCGWLRHYYPIQFLTCALNINKDNLEKTNAITAFAGKHDIHIYSPKFRHSGADYTFDLDNRAIYKGIASIKHLSAQVAEELSDLKDFDYDSFFNFLNVLRYTSIDSRALNILTSIDFFSEFGEINELLMKIKQYNAINGKKQIKKSDLGEKYDIPEYLVAKYAGKITNKMFVDIDSDGLLKEWGRITKYPKTTILDKIRYELKYLGYISTIIPKASPDVYFVTDIKGYNGNIITLCSIKTGLTEVEKFKRDSGPIIAVGDLIKITERTTRNKYKKIGVDEKGKPVFERLEEMEVVVSGYEIRDKTKFST